MVVSTWNITGQNVGINTTTPHPNAILDIRGVKKGLLIPRGNPDDRTTLNSNTAKGLLMYDTITNMIWVHNGNGLASGWQSLSAGTNHWSLSGALGTEITNSNTGGFWSANPTTVLSDPGLILPPVSGPGTRMMWIPQKSAFRVGSTDANHWDGPSIGLYSFAGGLNTTARGSYAIAMGTATKALGLTSTSFGWFTNARGDISTSIGFKTYAKSYASLSIGRWNDSIAISNNTTWIKTDPLFIIGNGTSEAARHNAMVIYKDGNMVLKNPNAFYYNKLEADYPLPVSGEGTRMMWLPELSGFRVGTVTDTAWNSTNIGLASFGSGINSIASGNVSTAMGFDTKASGDIAMAIGNGNIAKGYSSLTLGVYNDPILTSDQEEVEPSTPLFIIGNGDGPGEYERRNAMVVRKDGRVGIGTNIPSTNLDVIGAFNTPSIPDSTSTAILRIGVAANEGIDFGKMSGPSYAGWIQSGYAGYIADPLVLQPSGGNVGIGNVSPESSAILDVSSTTKGFLPPRMTFANRNSIASPATGLVIYCLNCSVHGQLQVFNGFLWQDMTGGVAADVPVVGDLDGGGKVAYIFQPGDPGYIAGETHGLIAAISDQGAGYAWACLTEVPGADATALGTGNQNTEEIIAHCGIGDNAVSWCYVLNQGGYSDWYLPSKNELNKLYLNKIAIGNFADELYWCSSEAVGANAWTQFFLNGTQNALSKTSPLRMRAVRTF